MIVIWMAGGAALLLWGGLLLFGLFIAVQRPDAAKVAGVDPRDLKGLPIFIVLLLISMFIVLGFEVFITNLQLAASVIE